MVKFAKYQPMASVNEEMMRQAEDIVKKTKSGSDESVTEVVENVQEYNICISLDLSLLVVIPVMIAWYFWKGYKRQPSVKYSSLGFLKGFAPTSGKDCGMFRLY